jgi:hypothetical protein
MPPSFVESGVRDADFGKARQAHLDRDAVAMLCDPVNCLGQWGVMVVRVLASLRWQRGHPRRKRHRDDRVQRDLGAQVLPQDPADAGQCPVRKSMPRVLKSMSSSSAYQVQSNCFGWFRKSVANRPESLLVSPEAGSSTVPSSNATGVARRVPGAMVAIGATGQKDQTTMCTYDSRVRTPCWSKGRLPHRAPATSPRTGRSRGEGT